jgi:pimeloyl-ACP methyl ester carboxylesterase
MPARGMLAYDERGAGASLVLVHGHPFNRSMWQPQAEALSSDFRVIALDLPGYGESPQRSEVMTMRAFAEAVVELCDQLALERSIVIGLSMGGLVAMELGLGYPDRFNGLVLAATTADPVTAGEAEIRAATARVALERGMLPLAAEMIVELFGPKAARDRTVVLKLFEMMLSTSPAGAAAALRGRAERPDYSSVLRSLTVPALVISGDHDTHSPEPVIRRLLEALPNPALVRCHDSGHLPNLEEPERFNDAVRQFAKRVTGEATLTADAG